MSSKPSIQAPLGFKLRHTLRGHRNRVYSLAWSPDGKMLASPSGDMLIHIWDTETRKVCNTIKFDSVEKGEWSPNGQTFITAGRYRSPDHSWMQLWNSDNFDFQNSIEAPQGTSHWHNFACSSDGSTLAVWGYDGEIHLFDVGRNESIKTLKRKGHSSRFGAWSPDGKFFASVSQDSILIWNVKSGKIVAELEGYYDWNSQFAWSLDSEIIAFGATSSNRSRDYNVKLWNIKKGQFNVLEGHTSRVKQVAFSHDGRLLITNSTNDAIRFWRCDTWQLVTFLKDIDHSSQIAINPKKSTFAILGENARAIHIWDFDVDTILKVSSSNNSVRYRNAKVVLIGDSGVGKSGLGMVLAGETFKATTSTHGRHVWSLEAKHHKTSDELWEIRETLLWDLAGQAEYRLIHQLSLDQINVALVLFDGSSPTNPFKEVVFWNKALQQAKGSNQLKKYLVAARTDVSSLSVTEARMNDFAKEHGFDGIFRTAALTGLGIEELRQHIEETIDWDNLPLTISESLFKQMKDFVVEHKRQGYILEKTTNLIQHFRMKNLDVDFEDQDFQAALGRVEAYDLIKILSFGDYVLLQPELLDNYASAMAKAAREQPDGLGFLDEQVAREGQFNFGSLDRVTKDDEQIILQSVVELFIEKELAIADKGKLIFPSQFNRELPEHPEVQGTVVSYQFEGALINAYTTLVVRLYHSEAFVLDSLWKNAAIFLPYGFKNKKQSGKRCGFVFKEIDEGLGRISVFFGVDIPDETKILFLKFVHEHLKHKSLNNKVVRERIYHCPKCQEAIERRAVQFRLEKGYSSIICNYCSIPTAPTYILLTDLIEETFGKDDDFLAKVRQMDEKIDVQLGNDSKEAILKGEIMVLVSKAGQIFRPLISDDWGIDGEIEFKNAQGEASGQRIYVQLKSGASYLKPRKDGTQVFSIPKKRHIQYWQSQNYPVYLVIRDKDEKMYWMNISEYLKTRTDLENRVIPFNGVEVTLETVKDLRIATLRQS
ncbi:DUF4365 domain-containing protein [Pseudanabaena minima]|uniref:DUF4365 domain-containing protein n=1 Tax=Pseudanabaena minima TaxID=890415 RepID=UPI003DA7EA28